jgi:hypothetical protein
MTAVFMTVMLHVVKDWSGENRLLNRTKINYFEIKNEMLHKIDEKRRWSAHRGAHDAENVRYSAFEAHVFFLVDCAQLLAHDVQGVHPVRSFGWKTTKEIKENT